MQKLVGNRIKLLHVHILRNITEIPTHYNKQVFRQKNVKDIQSLNISVHVYNYM